MKSIALAFTTALLAACAPQAPSDVTVLTYASPYSPSHPFSRADAAWMNWITERSGGRLRIRPYWSSAVLSSEHSMTEIRHGVVDVGLITPIYARGGAHLIHVQAAYYAGLTTFRQQVALYRCMERADPQFGRELHDLQVLAVQGGNLPGIVTRTRAVHTLEDLRGLRLRAPAELLEVLRRFGADPVDMPMGEVYSALAKGVLDGVVAPADTLRSLHFAEVAHHFNTLRVPRGAYPARAIGLRRWNSLGDEERAILREGVAVWEGALERQLREAEIAGEAAGRANAMDFVAPSAAETARFLEVYNEIAERNATRASRYGIDGLRLFRYARAVVGHAVASGEVDCAGGKE